ncbi:unnamed protein product [Protopolystoma xenopodis]|uniref:BTB domain-containing protein n=1 Tax=Protopolystoma xenopodis TaxID=117903 RepID=A0A448X404_9PLAT|nr:unnamed protein product [Protopolystoma xenopodis]
MEAGDIKIPAHRNILASSSPYFHAMFTGSLEESRAPNVKLHGVDAAALMQLIDFIYSAD